MVADSEGAGPGWSITGTPGKASAPSGGNDTVSEGGGTRWSVAGGDCEGVNQSGDGEEEVKGVGSPGNRGGDCEGVNHSGDDEEEVGGMGPPGGGWEEPEGVSSSNVGWRRSFDMMTSFLTTTGTTTSLCVSYISRTTGAASTRLKMKRIRRI
jgi:hypothetical protein